MKLFHPDFDQIDNGFKTSFTFDNDAEEESLINWLSYMDIGHLRSKIPVIVDGTMSHHTCVIIDMPIKAEDGEDQEDAAAPVEEVVVEKKKKTKKNKEVVEE
jgi:hypothetical protein